jgi:hypothetical protein
MRRKGRKIISCLISSWLALATLGFTQEQGSQREKEARRTEDFRRWNASVLFGSTKFRDSEGHQTLGGTLRVQLTDRISVEPEFRYLNLPRFESSSGEYTWKHSDLAVAGHIVYDLADRGRFVPYVTGGAGWIQTRNESSFVPIPVENAVPVFPRAPPLQSTTSTDVTNWLWLGGGFGVRVVLPRGFFVSPEVRLGGGLEGDLSASAVVKMGYAF